MSRLDRRHDKLLREYLAVARERVAAEDQGASAAHVRRLLVKERTLAGTIRRLRLRLGLTESFDAEHETARLGLRTDRIGRPRQPLTRRPPAPLWAERRHVYPVPVPVGGSGDAERFNVDLTVDLVTHSARFCGRRAADEVLTRRAAAAGREPERRVAWPERPLARTDDGELFAGVAGSLMGELVARAFDDDAARHLGAVAVRNYVVEFTATVAAALLRERDDLAPDERPDGSEIFGLLPQLRRDLARACYERIVAEVRAVRPASDLTADDVATIETAGQEPADP